MKKTKGTGALEGVVPEAKIAAAARAGCVQAHGVVFTLDAATGVVRQASANAGEVLGVPPAALIGESLDILGGDLAAQVRVRLRERVSETPQVFFGTTRLQRGRPRGLAGMIHRNRDGVVVVEVIPSPLPDPTPAAGGLPSQLARAIGQLGTASRLADLAHFAAGLYRELTGFSRVIVYQLPISGAGEVLGESHEAALESWLGVGFPGLDAVARGGGAPAARACATADVAAPDVDLVPRLLEPIGNPPDLARASLAAVPNAIRNHLCSASATAGFVSQIVRAGEPWGVVVGYHPERRHLSPALHSACELVAELTAARVAVIENFARAAAASAVRRLDEHLLAKTLSGGAWQDTVLEDARDLMALVGADGLALLSEGQIRCSGGTPPDAALQSLAHWLASQPLSDGVLARDSLPQDFPDSAAIGPGCAGVLAVELSRPGGEFLLWFRRETVRDVRGADGASQPSRGECRPWSATDVASARAVAVALRDVSVQVRSMSYLLVEDRLEDLSRALQDSDEGILIADGSGHVRFVNQAFQRLFALPKRDGLALADLATAFGASPAARSLAESLLERRQNWEGELALEAARAGPTTVAVRAEVIPRLDGFGALGFILLVTSLAARDADESARNRAREAIRAAQGPLAARRTPATRSPSPAELVEAVSASASLAVQEVAQATVGADAARTLESLDASSRRATELALQVLALAGAAIPTTRGGGSTLH